MLVDTTSCLSASSSVRNSRVLTGSLADLRWRKKSISMLGSLRPRGAIAADGRKPQAAPQTRLLMACGLAQSRLRFDRDHHGIPSVAQAEITPVAPAEHRNDELVVANESRIRKILDCVAVEG